MRLQNGEHGYGLVTKSLHWLTFLVIVAQFVVGYTMEDGDDRFDRREDACEATVDSDAAEAEEERCEEAVDREEDAAKEQGEDQPSDLHVALGITILALAVLRVLWRFYTPLPPWSPGYSAVGRTLQGTLERLLMVLLFAIPITGLLMSYGVEVLAWHVATHVAFFVVVGLHIGLQLFHTVIKRDGHLQRML